MTTENEYVLGTHNAEIERLGLQHRAWRSKVLAAWRSASIGPGQTVLDVGCGPGYAALDLAELVGGSGRVVAIDKSQRFLDTLNQMGRDRGFHNITTFRADFDAGEFPEVMADGVWCRWIFAFLKNPRDVLARVAAAIKPGGAIAIHEYFDYATWRSVPPCREIGEFVSAVMASWRASGGEPDIGLRLPGWLEDLGFELRVVHPIVEAVQRDQLMWAWLRAFVEINRQRLVELGCVTGDSAKNIWQSFVELEAKREARMITPGVLEIIAARR